ncbi:MAG: response regulator [Anaerolineales bacterium]|nr:response regulator [Anaerolineales bacterium]
MTTHYIADKSVVDILLVEDNPDDEELTLLTLEENNIANHIKVVRDGAEALAYIFGTGEYTDRDVTERPRLILLDLKLPKVNGIEVLERIKQDDDVCTIPVVVLTSSREEPDVARCYKLGANSYIVKPVDFDQFKKAIQQIGLYWQNLNEPPV